jgi:hypothetical protein
MDWLSRVEAFGGPDRAQGRDGQKVGKESTVGQKSASGKFGASSPLRLPQLLSLAVDFRE